MLDLKKVREQLPRYQADLDKRGSHLQLEEILLLDDHRKDLQQQKDRLKFQQKELATRQDYEGAKTLKQEIQHLEEQFTEVVERLHTLQLQMPNFLSPAVPQGKDETENQEIRTGGTLPNFDFVPQDHLSLMKRHQMVDIERGVKLAGARSYFLIGDGMLLEQALLHYALQKMLKKGFTPFSVPHLVNPDCLVGTGYFPGGEEDAYWMERDDQWLIATSEIPLTSYYANEVLSEQELPKKMV